MLFSLDIHSILCVNHTFSTSVFVSFFFLLLNPFSNSMIQAFKLILSHHRASVVCCAAILLRCELHLCCMVFLLHSLAIRNEQQS